MVPLLNPDILNSEIFSRVLQATLEEVKEADVLLHVLDAASPAVQQQRLAVMDVLRYLGFSQEALHSKVIEVWNKADLLSLEPRQSISLDEPLSSGDEDSSFEDESSSWEDQSDYDMLSSSEVESDSDADNHIVRVPGLDDGVLPVRHDMVRASRPSEDYRQLSVQQPGVQPNDVSASDSAPSPDAAQAELVVASAPRPEDESAAMRIASRDADQFAAGIHDGLGLARSFNDSSPSVSPERQSEPDAALQASLLEGADESFPAQHMPGQAGDFNTGGTIDTIDDVAALVAQRYEPQALSHHEASFETMHGAPEAATQSAAAAESQQASLLPEPTEVHTLQHVQQWISSNVDGTPQRPTVVLTSVKTSMGLPDVLLEVDRKVSQRETEREREQDSEHLVLLQRLGCGVALGNTIQFTSLRLSRPLLCALRY